MVFYRQIVKLPIYEKANIRLKLKEQRACSSSVPGIVKEQRVPKSDYQNENV